MLKQAFLALAVLLAAHPAFALAVSPAAVPPGTQAVRYAAATDRLSLDVKDITLSELLARISRQSGVEILIDPAVDHPVTASLQDQPLETALQGLTRGMNAVLIHEARELPGKGRQTLLVRMELLPVGQTNTALLRPVLSPAAEALWRAKGRDPVGLGKFDRINARYQARLEKMPPAQRERLEKQVTARVNRKASDKAARAEDKAERQRKQLERLNARLTRLQARAATNPEGSQLRIEQINKRIARIQQDRQGKAQSADDSTP